jgi:Fe-Mn family superoxide dismutase
MLATRRQALKTLTAAAIASTALGRMPAFADAPAAASATAPTGPFKLPPLPYAYDALEPYIDAETMHLHHDKHHAAYVKKLNEAVAKEPSLATTTNVDDLLINLARADLPYPAEITTAIRNQGGGHANHSLFWKTLTDHSSSEQSERAVFIPKDATPFYLAVTEDLGGLDKLKAEMAEQGGKLFGSGWVWLVLDGGKKLTVMTLPNQDSPLTEGHYPLFGIDVWEHAYYLNYHNVRADYIAAIWNVVNWAFISDRYAAAMKA